MLQKITTEDNRYFRFQYLLAFLLLLVYGGSLFFPLMDKDAAHHANIALHMYEHHDYISLIDRGNDYLDKPHFLFWTSALSFKLFGVNTFAHRFPAVLFALISVFSTYKLARHLSDRPTAKLAAFLLATAQAFVLSIIDARMETPLTAAILFGLWQLILYIDKRNFVHVLGAAIGLAIAFSTKGWLGPGIALLAGFFYVATQKKWSVLLSPKTWLIVPLFALFISPVLYAYYQQYDLHPEKIIRGQDHISGVRFILWDQLFERYKGFDEGGRNSSYFFLYHTFLWAFFPWSIAAYIALGYWLKRIFFRRKWRHPFNFSAMAFALVLLGISFSKFKMPHYIIMLLPLAALFTAPYLRFILRFRPWRNLYGGVHFVLSLLLLLVTLVLNFYFFPPRNLFVWIIGCTLLLFAITQLFSRENRGGRAVYIPLLCSLVFNFFMNYNFFPSLMKYQGGNEMVMEMKAHGLVVPDDRIVQLDMHAHSFDFYSKHNHPLVNVEEFPKLYPDTNDQYFLLTTEQKNFLLPLGYVVQPVISEVDYNVATLKLDFLNPSTRNAALTDTLMLARIYKR